MLALVCNHSLILSLFLLPPSLPPCSSSGPQASLGGESRCCIDIQHHSEFGCHAGHCSLHLTMNRCALIEHVPITQCLLVCIILLFKSVIYLIKFCRFLYTLEWLFISDQPFNSYIMITSPLCSIMITRVCECFSPN